MISWIGGRLGYLRPITNIDLTTIVWKATRTGARGVEDLAVDPSRKGGNHARTVRRALGLKCVKEEECGVVIPMWDSDAGERVHGVLAIKLPHEILSSEFVANRAKWEEARADADWIDVPSFTHHEVTQRFGRQACWPISYFTDKVKLGNTDVFLAWLSGVHWYAEFADNMVAELYIAMQIALQWGLYVGSHTNRSQPQFPCNAGHAAHDA